MSVTEIITLFKEFVRTAGLLPWAVSFDAKGNTRSERKMSLLVSGPCMFLVTIGSVLFLIRATPPGAPSPVNGR
jgi:hypothetical protein